MIIIMHIAARHGTPDLQWFLLEFQLPAVLDAGFSIASQEEEPKTADFREQTLNSNEQRVAHAYYANPLAEDVIEAGS